MPTRAELTLAALGLIQHSTPDAVIQLALLRGITPDVSWGVYKLAKALIDPSAVWCEVSVQDRETLHAIDRIHRSEKPASVSVPDTLYDPDAGHLRPEVVNALDVFGDEWSVAVNSLRTLTAPTTTLIAPAERPTFSPHLPRIIDVLDELEYALTLVGSETVSQRTPSNTQLHKALTQLAPDVSADWLEAIEWGVNSGLLIHRSGQWWVADSATKFIEMDRASKLEALITSWWESLGDNIRSELTQLANTVTACVSLRDYLHFRYPLLNTATLDNRVSFGQALGVVSPTGPTTLLNHLVAGDDLASVITAALPAHAPGVYPDGVDSVVGAGPLSGEHKQVLELAARCVRTGMAPRWVIDRDVTLATLAHLGSEGLVRKLGGVIVGGVPDSLVAQIIFWEDRARSLTLTTTPQGTTLHCADQFLSELLMADQKLQPMQLARRSELTLDTPHNASHARQFLLDAGYPTFPPPGHPSSSRVWVSSLATDLPRSWWEDLVASATEMSANAVWTEDILRDAIADRTLLALTVSVADTKRQMVVEPRSIAGGRLRVKDTAADVERTLPLSTIVSVEPAQRVETKTA